MTNMTRRDFLAVVGAAGATLGLQSAPRITVGYAAITWGADIVKAMRTSRRSVSRAFSFAATAFAQFGDRPKALRELLSKHHLTFAVLSSGNLSIDPAVERDMLALHVHHARFVRAPADCPSGDRRAAERPGRAARTTIRPGSADDRAGQAHHRPRHAARLPPSHEQHGREAARNRRGAGRRRQRHVRLLFDVAHYQQGGGDPVARFGGIATGSRSST